MRPIEFLGDSLPALRDFPKEARRQAGFQLDKVQKKTQRTLQSEIKLARVRFKEAIRRQR